MVEKTYLDEETKKAVYLHNLNNPYSDVLPIELGIRYPKISYNGFFPQKGEAIIYAAPAFEFQDKEKVVGYTGKSSGASVRVAKGLTLHTGGRGGKAIRQNVRDSASGDYIVTNKRIVFLSNANGFEFNLDKITAVKPSSKDSIYIQAGKTVKNIQFNEYLARYALGLTNFAVEQCLEGKDLYHDLTVSYSEDESKRIEDARSSLNAEKKVYEKSAKKKGNKGKRGNVFLKILVGLITLFIIWAVIGGLSGTKKVEEPVTSVADVLAMTDHPRINDDIEDVKAYYEKFNNDKVVVTDTYNYTNVLTRDRDLYGSEDSELYFVEDPSDRKILGRISFILNEKQVEGLNLDKCLKILNQYLPEDFYDVYKVDASYIVDNEGFVTYTYAVRLKDDIPTTIYGSDEKNHSYYYAIYVRTNTNYPNNTWIVETDYSAYGDKDKGWIEKYAKPWNVNLQDYK